MEPCDCEPKLVIVTVTLTDDAGHVRAVRSSHFRVRPHHHHNGGEFVLLE